MKTIYISGKIEGLEYYEAARHFYDAWRSLMERFSAKRDGVEYWPSVINPMDMREIPNGTWQDYIERDLIYLKRCNTIYMLRDWKDSAGARVEHEFAKKLGLEIIYEEEEDR